MVDEILFFHHVGIVDSGADSQAKKLSKKYSYNKSNNITGVNNMQLSERVLTQIAVLLGVVNLSNETDVFNGIEKLANSERDLRAGKVELETKLNEAEKQVSESVKLGKEKLEASLSKIEGIDTIKASQKNLFKNLAAKSKTLSEIADLNALIDEAINDEVPLRCQECDSTSVSRSSSTLQEPKSKPTGNPSRQGGGGKRYKTV
jgi:hypothetical protein